MYVFDVFFTEYGFYYRLQNHASSQSKNVLVCNILAPNRRAKKNFASLTRGTKVWGASRRCDVMTQLRHWSTMPFPFTCPYITHYGLIWGELGEKKCKKKRFLRKYDFITLWRRYVTIFFSWLHMSVYYMHLFWRLEADRREYKPPRAIFWGDLIDFTAKFANVFEP